eukprot:GFYU01001247.1.p1 GENE.GFYU01001247.1~~GFYU01001247.1.p1  ORF type:complete len:158 (-),score=14.76 GFYU01001247.1:312-785(-)
MFTGDNIEVVLKVSRLGSCVLCAVSGIGGLLSPTSWTVWITSVLILVLILCFFCVDLPVLSSVKIFQSWFDFIYTLKQKTLLMFLMGFLSVRSPQETFGVYSIVAGSITLFCAVMHAIQTYRNRGGHASPYSGTPVTTDDTDAMPPPSGVGHEPLLG